MNSYLSAKHLHDEEAAYAWVETRVWPNGPVCPHCGAGIDKVGKLNGKSTRIGTYKCYATGCRKPFTVKIGTIFEDSHVPMHKWLQAIFLLTSSKKGVSSNQLHRTLGVTLKTAWFMSHRIRLAMEGDRTGPLGSGGGAVEADETFIWNKKGYPKVGGGVAHKMAVMSLVERGGDVRSFRVARTTKREVAKIINANVAREARLMTDTASYYRHNKELNVASHEMVNHMIGEYVRGEAHTNTLEGYYSIFKRGMRGVYQHCAEKNLHRYAAEFDFRFNNRVARGVNDTIRAENALLGIVGKRMYYRVPA